MDFITLQNRENHQLIQDLFLHPLKINKDASGTLVETLRSDWEGIYGPGREFAMQYYSRTPAGLARDESVWHYHPTTQEDRFLVIEGRIVVAVADNREDSKTRGLLNLFYMRADKDPYIVLIPKKTLHGFMVVSNEDAILLNFPTSLYNPSEEERVPYENAGIKLSDGTSFSWDLVRTQIPALENL